MLEQSAIQVQLPIIQLKAFAHKVSTANPLLTVIHRCICQQAITPAQEVPLVHYIIETVAQLDITVLKAPWRNSFAHQVTTAKPMHQFLHHVLQAITIKSTMERTPPHLIV